MTLTTSSGIDAKEQHPDIQGAWIVRYLFALSSLQNQPCGVAIRPFPVPSHAAHTCIDIFLRARPLHRRPELLPAPRLLLAT